MTAVEAGTVVFIHGAGLDPHLYDPVIQLLDMPAVAPLRPAYESDDLQVPTVEQQATDILGRIGDWSDDVGGAAPVTIVGVSGGATIALAAAIALAEGFVPDRPVAAIIAHEPLLGPLAPALHRRVGTAAASLGAGAPEPASVSRFVSGLVGADTWAALPARTRAFATDRSPTVAADVERFAAYEPTADQVASIDDRLVTTIGERSGPERLQAATALAEIGGVRIEQVTGADHLANWQAPDALAEIISRRHHGALEVGR